MGAVGSRMEEAAAGLQLRDQTRFSIAALTITDSHQQVVLRVTPNSFPATKCTPLRDDARAVEYVQDVEGEAAAFIVKIAHDEELLFNFTLVIRQTQQPVNNGSTTIDTALHGLSFLSSSTSTQLYDLMTLQLHADPNLHQNSMVNHLGDYSTNGNASIQFNYSWLWRPPKLLEDRGGGWSNACCFAEYDARAHKLIPLATFKFWVANQQQYLSNPSSPLTPAIHLSAPPKLRIPSGQSIDSRTSAVEVRDIDRPSSPAYLPVEMPLDDPIRVDLAGQRPGEDISASDDGPVFRATMKALEQKTGMMRTRMKKVLKKAEAAHEAQVACIDAISGFMDALREASSSNRNAVQPALEHYFDKIAREILQYEKENTLNLQRIIIDPLSKVYQLDIKQAEIKRRDFEEESKEYYQYVSRYLGQRQDSMKEKKRITADTKYQTKRRDFELKRFDYSSFMQDLHGGRKEQEVLSNLTRFADAQTKSYLSAAKRIEDLQPQLDALSTEVKEIDKQFQFQRTEREEKRRNLEKSTTAYVEPDQLSRLEVSTNVELERPSRIDTGSSQLRAPSANGTISTPMPHSAPADFSRSPSNQSGMAASFASSPVYNAKFKGIRDLEEKDPAQVSDSEKYAAQRKEGLLWALSRPGSHVDPKGLNKQAWHKFWIVLDGGRLSEYSNWKQKLDLHMDPIDLRMASVREARNAERRFCFEVITPHYKRVYQATSEEDMGGWIASINSALQSAMEGRGMKDLPEPRPHAEQNMVRQHLSKAGQILTGKSSSVSYGHHSTTAAASMHSALSPQSGVFRRTTVGARPPYGRTSSANFEDAPDRLLKLLRDTDHGNRYCADCNSESKVEWVSLNLAIILCIECSGIHRSLGTHISKIRSLTLDTASFTTDIVELLLLIGNRIANMVWEALLPFGEKPGPNASREQRLRFITSKYVDRHYVEKPRLSPDETLLSAIKRNEIKEVVYALAVRASPNAIDRVRATPAFVLALAAADPASPSQIGSSRGASIGSMANTGTDSITTSSSGSSTQNTITPFPVAELLVQNGADIPNTTNSPIPLSRGAQLYVDQKTGRVSATGELMSPMLQQPYSQQYPAPQERMIGNRNVSSDMTSGNAGGMAGSSISGSAFSRGSSAMSSHRLEKRISAGGRLAKSVIPER